MPYTLRHFKTSKYLGKMLNGMIEKWQKCHVLIKYLFENVTGNVSGNPEDLFALALR